jgi:hypothetical protein
VNNVSSHLLTVYIRCWQQSWRFKSSGMGRNARRSEKNSTHCLILNQQALRSFETSGTSQKTWIFSHVASHAQTFSTTTTTAHLPLQGHKLDRIDFYVTKTGGYTDHGAAKLQKARKLKRKRRKVRAKDSNVHVKTKWYFGLYYKTVFQRDTVPPFSG